MNIEVEIRSIIPQEKYDELIQYFNSHATLEKEENDETLYFDCEQDLRIQKSDSGAKIILKGGTIHDEQRQELESTINSADFDTAITILEKIGYNIEIRWIRHRKQYKWNNITVCLDHTKGNGYKIELEIMSDSEHKEAALTKLKQKMSELNIKLSTKEEQVKQFEHYKANWKQLLQND